MQTGRPSKTIKNIKIGIGLSVAALALISLFSFFNLATLVRRSGLVDHTNIVLLELEHIISRLKDAQTGQRGYLLTRNPEFLEPYINSYEEVFETYNEVRRRTIDNKSQQLRLDTLRVLIAEQYESINRSIELENRGQSMSKDQLEAVNEGKKIMDAIRKLIDEMREEELSLRRERYEAAKTSTFYTQVLILIFSVISLGIAIIFFFILLRDAKKRLMAEKKLEESNAELAQINDELLSREEQLHELNAQLEEKVEEKTRLVIQGAEKLIESEKKFRLLVESIKDYAVFMISPEGLISSWNQGAKNLKGYSDDEVLGKHFSMLYPDNLKHTIEDELKQAREAGRFEVEGWRRRKDGSLFWASVLITPVYNEKNELIGFSKVTKDLTERKAYEDQLKQINSDLDNFIYAASHDLKAPVSNLEGLVIAVYEQIEDSCTEEIKGLFVMIHKSIEKLKIIIHELSEISKVQKGPENNVEEIDLNELLDEFRIGHREEISRSSVTIFSEFGIQKILFSRKNLRSVFQNILSNAIKYRSPERDPAVLIRSYREDGFAVLSFEDNGLGFDIRLKDKLFGMFKRLHDHVEGTGVGLYIVKKIVENAGGRIEVESETGKGSTFRIFLPAR